MNGLISHINLELILYCETPALWELEKKIEAKDKAMSEEKEYFYHSHESVT